jgi:hypothetical protein
VVALYQKASIEYLAVGPRGSEIGRSQEGESRRGIEDASFPAKLPMDPWQAVTVYASLQRTQLVTTPEQPLNRWSLA